MLGVWGMAFESSPEWRLFRHSRIFPLNFGQREEKYQESQVNYAEILSWRLPMVSASLIRHL